MEVPDKIIEVAIRGAYTVVVAGVSVFGTWKVAHRNGRNGKAKNGGCSLALRDAHEGRFTVLETTVKLMGERVDEIRDDVKKLLERLPKE